jgi:hypothetical protein
MQTYKLAKYTVSQYMIHDISKYILAIFRDITIFHIKNTIYDHYCKDIAYLHEGEIPMYKLYDFNRFSISIGSRGQSCDICHILTLRDPSLRIECYRIQSYLYHIVYCTTCFDRAYDIDGILSSKLIKSTTLIYKLAFC